MDNGQVQVYFGSEKETSRMVVGLSVEAIANNLKVIIVQFLKDKAITSYEVLKKLEPQLKVFCLQKTALMFAKKVMDTEECDILILDEAMEAVKRNLITEKELVEIIDHRPENMKLVLTGRRVPQEISERADEMKEVRNYERVPLTKKENEKKS